MPPACHQNDLYAFVVSTAQSGHIGVGNLKLWIEQGAVNVDGQKANGKRHWVSILAGTLLATLLPFSAFAPK